MTMSMLSEAQAQTRSNASPLLPWLFVAMAGVGAPAAAMLWLASGPAAAAVAAATLAVALMATGMIAASISGRLWVGLVLALLGGAGLVLLAASLGMPALANPVGIGLAMIIAGFSFAARGALFATSSGEKGWWIAVGVVAGEAAIVATAAAEPGALPDWLLVLLPAQWASLAIGAALNGVLSPVAIASLGALSGTAAATLMVRQLWPRRWTYIVMFTTWLGLSALVYHHL